MTRESTASINEQQLENYPRLGRLYNLLTGDEDTRVCKDIPDSSCKHQPLNFFAYLFSNLFTKIADELASARLILPWMLGALGAPAAFTGFLVPIREAGVLLPQLAVAAVIRRMAIRKSVWIVGAVLSALAMFLMAATVARFSGTAAGWAVVILITLYSLAKGLCSVAAKDVLGKTVSKTRRGILMGYSAGIAGIATLLLGLYIKFVPGQPGDTRVLFLFMLAGGVLWMLAVVIFTLIREEPGATEGGGNALTVALEGLELLKDDAGFRHFVIARGLLLSVALVPPFYVLMAQQYSSGIAGLGLLIIANGLAGSLSAPIWGRLGDRSSRLVMVIGAAATGSMGILFWLAGQLQFEFMTSSWTYAALFFLVATFHSGVRLGRKVYLVDMATTDNRATYVAVSNTVIGAMMLFGGGFGILADILETATVIGLLGLLSLLAAIYISGMKEVSG
ncbi:MAG TPA: MFS transporter [Gammaproteobacteria bacterium]|nr:MFS transporter [Gammaproteobacteria bacterium]